MHALLEKSVDYAGLFPPATLSLKAAGTNYAEYVSGEHAWMLGRLVLPAERLQEFAGILASLRGGSGVWLISALVGQNFGDELKLIHNFNRDAGNRACVDSIEFAPGLDRQIGELLAIVPRECRTYFEVPLDSTLDLLQTIAQKGAQAKIRTGGLNPEAIPPFTTVASFIENCVKVKTQFKATAGLHHPIRSLHPLTYEPNAVTGEMHGFLNLLVACAFATHGAPATVLAQILAESDPASFRFTDSHAQWKRESIPLSVIRQMREELFTSFGSCSFQEPVEDLTALGWL
jgi:hypothetical protein